MSFDPFRLAAEGNIEKSITGTNYLVNEVNQTHIVDFLSLQQNSRDNVRIHEPNFYAEIFIRLLESLARGAAILFV